MKLFPKLMIAFGLAASVVGAFGLAVAWAAEGGLAGDPTVALVRVRTLGFALAAVPFGLALVLGVVIARTLGRRLGRIAAAAQAIGDGDLDARTGDTSSDEVGQLARALDATAAALAQSTVSRAHLDAVLESIPDPLAVLDGEGTLVRINDAGAALVGRSAEAVVGQPAFALFVPELEEVARFAEAISGTPSFTGLETRFQRADGTAVPVRLSAAKLPARGDERGGLVVVAQDISETHAAHRALVAARDRAERANRAKSDFLASMSHEIRTPLNGVIGMTGHLLETDLDAHQRDVAGVIRTSGRALLDVVNDVLDFSKIEAGRLDLEAAPFGVHACLDGAREVVAYRAEDKGVALTCEVDPALPSHVVGDGTRLRQVLLNLLANAVKFTEAGTVALTAEPCDPDALPDHIREGSTCERGLHLAVSDTGVGIAPDALAHLFDPFTQAEASTSRRFGGTGLGLAISKRLVEAMGGKIWAESEPGVGSTFHVIVPAEAAPTEAPAPIAAPARPTPTCARALRVLVAEDNGVNQRVVGLVLGRLGITPAFADDGDEVVPALAAAAAEGRPFDVAFLDLRMPRVGGVEAARAVRASDLPQPTLVALTADATPEVRERCLAAGMDAFLTKPLDADALAAVLDAAAPVAAPADDLAPLHRLTAGDPDALAALLAQARAELADGLTVLKDALRTDDLATVGLVAHTLRSTADLLADAALADACAATEAAADGGRLMDAVGAFLPLYATAQAAVDRLDGELAEGSLALAGDGEWGTGDWQSGR